MLLLLIVLNGDVTSIYFSVSQPHDLRTWPT